MEMSEAVCGAHRAGSILICASTLLRVYVPSVGFLRCVLDSGGGLDGGTGCGYPLSGAVCGQGGPGGIMSTPYRREVDP